MFPDIPGPLPPNAFGFRSIPAYLYRGIGTIGYVLPVPLQPDIEYYEASVAIQVVIYD